MWGIGGFRCICPPVSSACRPCVHAVSSVGGILRIPGPDFQMVGLILAPVAVQIIHAAVRLFIRPLDGLTHIALSDAEGIDIAGRFQGQRYMDDFSAVVAYLILITD